MLDCDVLLMLGTDFPYRQFYPRERGVRIAQVDIRPEQIGRRAAVDLGDGRRRQGDARRRCCRCSHAEDQIDAHLDAGAASTIAKARKSSSTSSPASPGHELIHPQQVAKAISDQAGDGRDLHLRRRPADGVGRALSRHERQAPAARLVLARLDGQCDGAGHRRARRPFPGGRWSSLSGDGGFTMLMGDFLSLDAAQPAGEGGGLQQQRAGLHRARAEIHGLPRFRHRASPIRTSPPWPRLSASAASAWKTRPRSRTASPRRSPMTGRSLIDAVVTGPSW